MRPPQALWGASVTFKVVLAPPPSLQRAGPSITLARTKGKARSHARKRRPWHREGASVLLRTTRELPRCTARRGFPKMAAGSSTNPRGERSAPPGSAVTPGHKGGWVRHAAGPGSPSAILASREDACAAGGRGHSGEGHLEMPLPLPGSAGPNRTHRVRCTGASPTNHPGFAQIFPVSSPPPTTLSTLSGVARRLLPDTDFSAVPSADS